VGAGQALYIRQRSGIVEVALDALAVARPDHRDDLVARLAKRDQSAGDYGVALVD
jgi:hypothetical protein